MDHGIHQRNAAERAVRTFKNHFIAGLCSVDPQFPLHLWDRLLPQAKLTLNLLRGSRINPKLSAWAQVHGQFDFNVTPLGPPGTRVLAFEDPGDRTTWSLHGLDGWYIGPAMESYRCHEIYITETRGTRTLTTVKWYPHEVKLPPSSSIDIIMNSLQDIVHALGNPAPRSPLAPPTDSHTEALHQLVELITNVNNRAPAIAEPTQPSVLEEQAQPPPLRVPITPTTAKEQREPTPNLIEDDTTDASPLRVAKVVTTTQGTNSEPHLIENDLPQPPVNIIPAPTKTSTLVEKPQFPRPIMKPLAATCDEPTAPDDTSRPADQPLVTYTNSTGPTGHRNRKKKAIKPRPTKSKAIGPHPEPKTNEAKLRVPLNLQKDTKTTAAITTDNPTKPAPSRKSRRSPKRTNKRLNKDTDEPPALIASSSADDSSDNDDDSPPAKTKPYNTRRQPARRPQRYRINGKQALEAGKPTKAYRSSGKKTRQKSKAQTNLAQALNALPDDWDIEPHYAMHGTTINPNTGNVADFRELSQCSDGPLWVASNMEEINRMVDTGTLVFIHRHQVPKHKRAKYIRVVSADRPEKEQTRRIRWTIGGDHIQCDGNSSTKVADIVTTKLLLNSVISTPGARFMTLDLKDFYLNTDLAEYEYVKIPLSLLPQAAIDKYNLTDKIIDGHVYAEVRKGMYGLPHAGKIANDKLQAFLKPQAPWIHTMHHKPADPTKPPPRRPSLHVQRPRQRSQQHHA
jgi:hypothetical protein